MKQGDVYHGFTVTSVREIAELKATLYEMEYVKNGAKLLWLDSGNQNMLFSIAFKTIPADDTGVFHILEHSVLSGSEKYPVKDPFLYMMKSSMKTFLNAMTFSDKTVYPVSSRNEADFMNLVGIYLDAVFCPSIYDSPYAFYQEGWHYELNDVSAQPVYKGVVYNEMKGTFSSVDVQAETEIKRMLFPDTPYRFVSGGHPDSIPDLSYEDYLAAHREFYHPSNAKIYIDGNAPIDRVLALLDTYLCRYEKSDVTHDIPLQVPVAGTSKVKYYSIGEEDDTAGRVQMVFGKTVCDYSDRKKLLALSALASYLTDSNESPLKQALLKAGLAQDAYLDVEDGIAQPYCYLRISNTEYELKDKIKETVLETVNRILAEGLDYDELDAVINQLEFQLREFDEPVGLDRNLAVLDSWLYGGDPGLYLTCTDVLASLRESMQTGYFDDLLRELLLDWTNMAELYMLPSVTKGAEDAEAERKRLADLKAGWSSSELQSIVDMNREFSLWQSAPDTAEAINKLPFLSLEQIGDAPVMLSTEHKTIGSVPVLFHPVKEQEIIHFNIYFPIGDIPKEQLPGLSFLTNLLGVLGTTRYSAYELQREIKRNIGFLDYNVTSYSLSGKPGSCKPYFVVSVSTLRSRLRETVLLLAEILNNTVYIGDESADMIYEILMQCYDGIRQDILENGHVYARQRAASQVSAEGWFTEQTSGLYMFEWLDTLAERFDERICTLQDEMKTVQDTVFSSGRMVLSVTSDEVLPEFEWLAEALDKGNTAPAGDTLDIPPGKEPLREIVRIPAGVSYSASVNNLSRYGMKYSGTLGVLSTILSYEYLWNEIRVTGGAYGCGCSVGMTGNLCFYSYRDPSPISSVSVYKRAADFVRTFCENNGSIDNYVISSIAAMEPLQSLHDQSLTADFDVFNNITPEYLKRIREEMLHTTKEDLLSFCDLLEAMARDNSVCILGNPAKDTGWSETIL